MSVFLLILMGNVMFFLSAYLRLISYYFCRIENHFFSSGLDLLPIALFFEKYFRTHQIGPEIA